MLQEEIGILKQNEWKPFWTDGSWSLHQLLEFILEQTGPSDIAISSFSISEASIRSIYNLIEAGIIKKLKCLFDTRTKKDKTDLLFFAAGITSEIFIANCHAKIIIITNKTWHVAIIGSANLTVNQRYECGVICTVPEVVNNLLNHFDAAVKNAVQFTFD